jgi:hypothetical protein
MPSSEWPMALELYTKQLFLRSPAMSISLLLGFTNWKLRFTDKLYHVISAGVANHKIKNHISCIIGG